MALTLILGNQLYRDWLEPSPIRLEPGSAVLMLEDLGIASAYRYHRLRLLHTFVAMRAFAERLREHHVRVIYGELEESRQWPFWQRLEAELRAESSNGLAVSGPGEAAGGPSGGLGAESPPGGEPVLRLSEVPDRGFQEAVQRFCDERQVRLEILPSPAFLESEAESRAWFQGRRRPFMKTFYERQRRRLGLLLDAEGGPIGGRWSYDSDNRRKLPKGYREPPLPPVAQSPQDGAVRLQIARYFASNPGELGPLFIPWDQPGADAWLETFLEQRLTGFGPYEDALSCQYDTLHHSLLSPLLNIGLLTPQWVLERLLAWAERCGIALEPAAEASAENPTRIATSPAQASRTTASRATASRATATPATASPGDGPSGPLPIASLEGFLRQVIGWREFVRGIDLVHGDTQAQANHWDHHRRLAPCWEDGSTGLPPLDRAIERVNRLAYNHHIERLMVISCLMLLCEIHPQAAHRWFMERYLDSYDWVMGPNVYGMGLMSDGGIFATKPYLCGSNYILKMGDDRRGPWCEIWDGLYWRFIDRHRQFFASNPRLAMAVRTLDRMEPQRRQGLEAAAEAFLERVTLPGPT